MHTTALLATLALAVSTTALRAEGNSMTKVAAGTFTVKLQPLEIEGAEKESKLGRMAIDKEILGDLVATTKGQMLTGMTGTKGSAGYVAMELVSGKIHGHQGTFVLQHSGIMTRGSPSLKIVVVPDSGTDELTGLEGEFNINIADGIHSYEFSYWLRN